MNITTTKTKILTKIGLLLFVFALVPTGNANAVLIPKGKIDKINFQLDQAVSKAKIIRDSKSSLHDAANQHVKDLNKGKSFLRKAYQVLGSGKSIDSAGDLGKKIKAIEDKILPEAQEFIKEHK